MLNKFVAFLLTFAIALFAFSPSKVLAQTQIEVKAIDGEQRSTNAPAKLKSDLKTILAKEIAKTKSDALTEADFKRFEKERFNLKSSAKLSEKRKTIIILIVIGVAITVGVVLLAKYGVDNPPPLCENEPGTLGCI